MRSEVGATPTLVLLPGLDGTGRLFEPFLAALPPELRVKVVRYPLTGQLSLAQLAEIAAAQLPAGPLVLLAESFSGLVVLRLLERAELPIRQVIFVASFAASPRPLLGALAAPFAAPLCHALGVLPGWLLRHFCIGSRDATALAQLRAALAEVAPQVLAGRLKTVLAARPAPPAPAFAVSALYLEALQDRLVPRRAQRALAVRFEHFSVVSLPGPHFLLQAAPQACADAVVRQIAGDGAAR